MRVDSVLLLEDDISWANEVARGIRSKFPRLQVAVRASRAAGRQALSMSGVDIKLAIVDIYLMDGPALDLITELLKKKIPVIVVTGYPNEDLYNRCIADGVAYFLTKPVPIEVMLNLVGAVLDESLVKPRDIYEEELAQILKLASSKNVSISNKEKQLLTIMFKFRRLGRGLIRELMGTEDDNLRVIQCRTNKKLRAIGAKIKIKSIYGGEVYLEELEDR